MSQDSFHKIHPLEIVYFIYKEYNILLNDEMIVSLYNSVPKFVESCRSLPKDLSDPNSIVAAFVKTASDSKGVKSEIKEMMNIFYWDDDLKSYQVIHDFRDHRIIEKTNLYTRIRPPRYLPYFAEEPSFVKYLESIVVQQRNDSEETADKQVDLEVPDTQEVQRVERISTRSRSQRISPPSSQNSQASSRSINKEERSEDQDDIPEIHQELYNSAQELLEDTNKPYSLDSLVLENNRENKRHKRMLDDSTQDHYNILADQSLHSAIYIHMVNGVDHKTLLKKLKTIVQEVYNIEDVESEEQESLKKELESCIQKLTSIKRIFELK